jgi:hypothetical protein
MIRFTVSVWSSSVSFRKICIRYRILSFGFDDAFISALRFF